MLESDYSFGNWIKRRRKALDLTQQELAKRVGCSLSLIFKIESDLRRPSRQIAKLLAEHLKIPPDQRDLFLKVARQQRSIDHLEGTAPLPTAASLASVQDSPVSVPHPPHVNLPHPLTSLVGRKYELDAIIQQIQDPACRLLTITGPGGVGKTRLALEIAHRLRDSFDHGVCFVSLAGTSASDFIVPAIADALGFVFSGGVELKTQLFRYLEEKTILLVLDNLEHILRGIELLDELLEAAPQVKLLTTSREQLDLRTEWTFEVQGLPVPASIQLENLESNNAVALFIQRAKQVNISFSPATEDLHAILRICQLVEGLPLGLEIAATWVDTLSCSEIATEIERGLDFLATSKRDLPSRHRSINAVFEYSWNLLSTDEQNVLRKLSVFRGGFQRDAGEQVAGSTLPLLSALVRKSLIRRNVTGRYDQHELVRQYAAIRLHEIPQTEISTLNFHAAYYLGLWRDREDQLKSAGQREAFRELVVDIDNFRSAWDQAASQRHFALLYPCLRSFLIVYDRYGWHTNAINRLETLIQALRSIPEEDHRAVDVLGLALSFQGWFYFRRGQLQVARDRFEQGLEILRSLDDWKVLADVLTLASPVMTSLGESSKALQYVNEGLNAARASGDTWRIAHALMMQGGILAGWGQYDQAYRSSHEALTRFRALGDTRLVAVTLNTLGYVALQSSRYLEAREALLESLALLSSTEDPWSAGTAYGNLGITELAQGNSVEAQSLLQKSIPLLADLGMLSDVAYFMTYLGEAALGLGASDEAEDHWLDAMHIAYKAQALPTVLAILIRLAQLQANRNDITSAYKLATQVASHPASWQDTKNRAEKLRSDLEPRLSEQEIKTMQIASHQDSLDHIIQEICA